MLNTIVAAYLTNNNNIWGWTFGVAILWAIIVVSVAMEGDKKEGQ